MGAPFQFLTHTLSLSGTSSSLRLDPRFPKAESPTHQVNLLSGTVMWKSSSWVPLERDFKHRSPWAIVPLQPKFPPHTSSPCSIHRTADPMVLFGPGVFLFLIGVLHCPWAGWRFFSHLQRGPPAVLLWYRTSLSSSCKQILGALPSLRLAGAQQKFTISRWQIHGMQPKPSVK